MAVNPTDKIKILIIFFYTKKQNGWLFLIRFFIKRIILKKIVKTGKKRIQKKELESNIKVCYITRAN